MNLFTRYPALLGWVTTAALLLTCVPRASHEW
jgi:hypothetical protein